jgi:autotransporter-associated beta strand protein
MTIGVGRARVLIVALCCAGAVAGFVSPASATTRIWTGSGGDANWSTSGNWQGNAAPVAGDVVQFDSTTTSTADLGAGVTVSQIHFTGSGNTINGAVTIDGSILFVNIQDDGDNNTIHAAIAMTGASTLISMTNAGQTLTMTGVISGSVGLVVTGDSAATVSFLLNTGNTYTGLTSVMSGIVLMNATSGTVIPGNVIVGSGTGTAVLRDNVQSSDIAANATVTIDSNGTLDLANEIENFTNLTINGGTVSLGASGALGVASALNMAGGSVTGTGIVSMGVAGSITATSDATSGASILPTLKSSNTSLPVAVNPGPVQPELMTNGVGEKVLGVAVTKSGSGQWLVNGTNTFTGTTTLAGGTLAVNGSQTLSTIQVSGGTLAGTGTVGTVVVSAGVVSPAGASVGQLATGAVSFNAGTYQVDLSGGQADAIRVSGTVNLANAVLDLNGSGLFVRQSPHVVIIDNDGSDPVTGTFSGLPEGTAIPVGSQTFHITYVGGDGNDVELIAPDAPPVIDMAATAHPPTSVGEAIGFQVGASDPNNDTLTYLWSFGDGTSGSGPNPSHAYKTAGTYDVSVTISDGLGGTTTSHTTVVVDPVTAIVGQGIDSDGDGFSDAFEEAAGSNPYDPADTPTGQAAGASANALVIKNLLIRLKFARQNSDSIKVGGTLATPAGLVPAGQKVVLDIGGIDRAFVLNSKGVDTSTTDQVKIGTAKGQKATFAVGLRQGSFAATLANEGLVGTATVKNQTKSIGLAIVVGRELYRGTAMVRYSAKEKRSGVATSR